MEGGCPPRMDGQGTHPVAPTCPQGTRNISCRTGGSPGTEGALSNLSFPNQVMLEPALGGGKRLEIKPYGPSQSPASDV